MKKEYIRPKTEATICELQGIVAASTTVKISNQTTENDAMMGHERTEFWSHTWE